MSSNKNISDEELTRMAAEELLREAQRGRQRAAVMGPAGWKKPPFNTNLVFFKNTLENQISYNSRLDKQYKRAQEE